jgi:branched-chain amino acid transport system substrate-binding protein
VVVKADGLAAGKGVVVCKTSEEAVRAVERLITQDKVDLLFPPWGTGLNLAVGPVFNKYGYPQLTFSAVTDRAPELAKRWPNSFWLLGTSKQYVDALTGLLKKMRDEGKIGPNIAMISIADGFGIDLSQAARKGFTDAGFKLAYDKSYPIGTQDLSPLIGEAQRSGADTFVAFSYPPDTMALTEQAKVASYAPKVLFLGVGVGFPMYAQRFAANVEGIMSLGGWSKDNAATQAYAKKHEELFKRGPDRWGSQIGYSSLQMLEQAIERVGKLDRAAIIKELQTGTFDTVLGKVKLADNMMQDNFWLIGQWQDGFFVGVAPQRAGVGTPVVPKPAWKN